MALTEEKKLEWEQTLRDLKLMEEGDAIEEHTRGDYWFLTSQTRGNFFFTKEKFIFVSGFGVDNFSIKYSDIREIKKCMISLFIPTGFKVTADNQDKGKTKKYKCSVMKRKDWMQLLAGKAGISLG